MIERLALEPVSRSGRDRLARWLADRAVADWWGSRAEAEARIAIALSMPSAVCRLVTYDSHPIGYAQAIDAALAEDHCGSRLEPGIAECMVFIGEAAYRGKGLWPAALDLLATEVLGSTLAVACAIAIPAQDERVVRAAERVGFRWERIQNDPHLGPMWIMLRKR